MLKNSFSYSILYKKHFSHLIGHGHILPTSCTKLRLSNFMATNIQKLFVIAWENKRNSVYLQEI